MASSPKLKPCPFCGGEAEMVRNDEPSRKFSTWLVRCGNQDCPVRPKTGFFTSANFIAELWNRRNGEEAPHGRA